VKYSLCLLVLAVFSPVAPHVMSQDFTPPGNLVGITKVHENISLALNLKGADQFQVDSQKITMLLRDALSSVGIGTNGSGLGTPMVGVSISGESTGGGGALHRGGVYSGNNFISFRQKSKC